MGAVSDAGDNRIEERMTPNEHHTPIRSSNAVK